VRIKTFEMVFAGAVFVVVALDDGDIQVAHDLEAFLGVGVVTDDVAEAYDVRGFLRADVLQHDLKSFQIAVDVCNDGVFHFLANNLKSPKFIFCVAPDYLFVPDKSSKTCIMERGAESFKFRVAALGDEFHAAIRQIADGAGDLKTGGDGLGGVTKADTLHAAGEKNGLPAARGGLNRLRHGGMKPKPRAGCNVFWRRGQRFVFLV